MNDFGLFEERQIAESEAKYDSYLDKLNELEALYEHEVISTNDYEKYKMMLESKARNIEDELYPYMTEAVNAASVSLLDAEIKELSSPKKDNIWIKQRISRFEKYASDLIPLKKLKKKGVKPEEVDKQAKEARRFIRKFKDPRKVSVTQYYHEDKPVMVFVKCIKGRFSSKQTGWIMDVFDSKFKQYEEYYSIKMDGKDAATLSANFVKMAKKVAIKEKTKLEKEVKESVMDSFDSTYSLDAIMESVDTAIDEGLIGDAVGEHYKTFVQGIHEKTMLDASLHKL